MSSDEDFAEALDFLLEVQIDSEPTTEHHYSATNFDQPPAALLNKRKTRDEDDDGFPYPQPVALISSTVIRNQSKKAFIPLYSQQYGLALDAPFRLTNYLAQAFNHHSSKVLGEHMNSFWAPNARMVHRLYGETDTTTGRARNRFGNFTMIEFNPVSQFYGVMQQCYDMTPDLIFNLLDFQSMTTKKGCVVNMTFTQVGTIVEEDSQVTFASKATDAIFEETENTKAQGFNVIEPPTEERLVLDSEYGHHFYEEEASALMAEIEGLEVDEAIRSLGRQQKQQSQLLQENNENEAEDEDEDEMFLFALDKLEVDESILQDTNTNNNDNDNAADASTVAEVYIYPNNSDQMSVITTSTANNNNAMHVMQSDDSHSHSHSHSGSDVVKMEVEEEVGFDAIEEARLTESIAKKTKPLHIRGLISMTLDNQGKVAAMDFFYQHLA